MTRQESKRKMASIVQNRQESGLSQIEYARTHDIKLVIIRYWISKNRQSSDAQTAFIQLNGICNQFTEYSYPLSNRIELFLHV